MWPISFIMKCLFFGCIIHSHILCACTYTLYISCPSPSLRIPGTFFFSTRILAAVCLTVPSHPPTPQLYCEFFLFLDDKDPWHSPWALFNNPSQTIKRMSLSEVKTVWRPASNQNSIPPFEEIFYLPHYRIPPSL